MKSFVQKKAFLTCLATCALLLVLGITWKYSFCHFPSSNHILAAPAEEISSQAENQSFEHFTTELFQQEIAADPLSLHYTISEPEAYGITTYNTSLGEYSADAPLITASLSENLLAVLHDFHRESLNPQQRLNYDILEYTLNTNLVSADFPYLEEPLRPSTGIQAELPILLAEYRFQRLQDVTDYLEILSSVPAFLDSICNYEQEKSETGLFMNDFAADTIIDQCLDFANMTEDNYLIETFNEKIQHITDASKNEKRSYIRLNQTLIQDKILPAYRNLAHTLSELKCNSPEGGLCLYGQGCDYYKHLVKQATGSSDPIPYLQERVALQRQNDLEQLAQLESGHPSLSAEMIAASAPCPTPEKMIKRLETQIKNDFPSISACHYDLKAVDASMEEYLAPAFYLSSPLDHYQENSIYINEQNGYEGLRLFTTLAHEGYPGHLYQNVAFCSSTPAPIRMLLGFPGYTEGWATYVEMLSYQYADLTEDVSSALALEQSATLSLYASADMGIHYDGWSFSQTCDFFSDYGFQDTDVIREIYELIIEEPAHYLKYYIGYLEFLELKKYAKESFGANYQDLAFHDALLKIGPAPFDIIREYLPLFYSVPSDE